MSISTRLYRLTPVVALLAVFGCTKPLSKPAPAILPPTSERPNGALGMPATAGHDAACRAFRMGTRSITACDPATGECGIAVVSFPTGVPAVIPVGDPGVA